MAAFGMMLPEKKKPSQPKSGDVQLGGGLSRYGFGGQEQIAPIGPAGFFTQNKPAPVPMQAPPPVPAFVPPPPQPVYQAPAPAPVAPQGGLAQVAAAPQQFVNYNPAAGVQAKGNINYQTVNEQLLSKYGSPWSSGLIGGTSEQGGGYSNDPISRRALEIEKERRAANQRPQSKTVFGTPIEPEQGRQRPWEEVGGLFFGNAAKPQPKQLSSYEQAQKEFGEKRAEFKESAEAQRAQLPVWGQLQHLQQAGVPYKNPQGGGAAQMDNIVRELSRWGINDLSQVGSTTTADGRTVVYNKATGQELPNTIGSGSKGEGFTKYKWMPIPGGGAIPVGEWEESSDRGKIAQVASIALAALAPYALPALAGGLGAMGAGALYGGVSGGLTSAIGGGDMFKGMAQGALQGTLGGAVKQYNPAGMLGVGEGANQSALNAAIMGAGKSGIGAAMNDQDIARAMLQGGISGGLGSYASSALGGIPLGGQIGGYLGGQAGSYLTDLLMGRPDVKMGGLERAAQGQLGQPGATTPNLPPEVLARMKRQFDLRNLSRERQQRIQKGFGKAAEVTPVNPNLDIEWLT